MREKISQKIGWTEFWSAVVGISIFEFVGNKTIRAVRPTCCQYVVCSASHTSFMHDRMLFNWIGYLEHRRCNWICCGTPGLFFDFNFLWTFRDDRSSALTRMHSSLDSKFWITWTIIVNWTRLLRKSKGIYLLLMVTMRRFIGFIKNKHTWTIER